MKLLGVDYGTVRIGLATGDTETGFVFPLRSVSDPDAVVAAAKEESADRIVIGVPERLSGAGKTGQTHQQVLAFIEALKSRTAIPIDTEDERLTTALAERIRKDANIKKSQFDKDAVAAAAILESYMQRLRH